MFGRTWDVTRLNLGRIMSKFNRERLVSGARSDFQAETFEVGYDANLNLRIRKRSGEACHSRRTSSEPCRRCTLFGV